MAEKDFQSEFGRGLVAAGCHYYKIPDPPVSQMRGAGVGRFTEAKPYDCYFLAKGGPWVVCELKQVKKPSISTGSEKSDLKLHQELALTQVESLGQVALVVVHFFFEPSASLAKRIGSALVDRAFAATIGSIVTARTESAKDCLPLAWWEEHASPLHLYRQGSVRCWDCSSILYGVNPMAAWVGTMEGVEPHTQLALFADTNCRKALPGKAK